ncbi:MAG: hypothetical protein WCP95_17410 [Actinomycetes bacterium]
METSATVLLVLSILGGAILIITAFVNQVCPAGTLDCYPNEMSPDFTLIGAGIAGMLVWVFIWALARAIAQRLRLAAAVARADH